jgi:RNA polymerase sigma-70 factor (sigma-E family)
MTFEEWARTGQPRLLRFAVVLCGGRHLAEDVVQEVLLRAHQRWDRISGLEYPDSYLHKMVVNEFLSWRRKWTRIEPRGVIEVVGTAPDPAGDVATRMELLTELCKLPKRQRVVVVLRYLEDQSDAEIAEVLGCTPGTVRGYLSRALARLRVQLSKATVEGAGHAH